MRELLFLLFFCLLIPYGFCDRFTGGLKAEVQAAVMEFIEEYQATVNELRSEVTQLKSVVTDQQRHIQELEARINGIGDKAKTTQASENDINAAGISSTSQIANVDNDAKGNHKDRIGSRVYAPEGDVNIGQNTNRDKRQVSIVDPHPHVAFSAYLDHKLYHVGLGQTIKYNQVLLNDGYAYNTHTGAFTAPITGVYFFTFHFASKNGKAEVRLVIDDENIVGSVVDNIQPENYLAGGNSAMVHMTVGQTAWTETYFASDQEIDSEGGYHKTTFTGFLLYST